MGAFGTTYLLIPHVGMNGIFLVSGSVLGVAGLSLMLTSPVGKATLFLFLLLPLDAAFLLSRISSRDVAEGDSLIAEGQSSYQSLRVVQSGSGDDVWRRLEVNEGLDSFQSVWFPNRGLIGQGFYYDLFALPPAWDADQPASGTWSTLILGLGAGTTVRVMEGAMPEGMGLSTVGVEIDPVVVELAQEFFDLEEGPDRVVHSGIDARVALALERGPFDQVAIDCYANQVEIPPHLATVEFFREVRDVLRPGGWVSINAAGFGLDDPVVDAVARTCATAFDQPILVVRVPFSRNCMLFARRDDEVPGPDDQAAWLGPGPSFHSLLRQMEIPDAWRHVEPKVGEPLTDAFSPMERLQWESLTVGRKRWLEAQP